MRGLSSQRALKRDEFITPELTNHLFQTEGFPFGLDLAAINIQRGRDHGIPSYTTFREPCGLSPVENWDDFSKVVGSESARRISFAYKSVHDIDLFVGGISERPVVGGLVGPTFACIIAQQFSNLRKGDRFWYENPNLPNSFTLAQLNSIRKTSFSQILCRSIGGGTLQPHIFLPHEMKNNERVLCGIGPLAPLDLRPWFDDSKPEIKEILSSTVTLASSTTMGSTTTISSLLDLKNNLQSNISIIPNGVSGLHKPDQQENSINDKLDFQSKLLLTKTTSQILRTHSPTTKKTFIINNVAVDFDNNGSNILQPAKNRKQRSVSNSSAIKAKTKQFDNGFSLPHKITFDAPQSDEYEIEINIKPTNKNHDLRPNYFENYQHQSATPFNHEHKKYSFTSHHTKATQPPTIIYLDDQTDTRTPGLLQNIFNFGHKTSTTTKVPNKLDNINSHFLSYPDGVSENYNPHSQSVNYDTSQNTNSAFSFTIRPISKPNVNSYYNTLPRPDTINRPHYNDHHQSTHYGPSSPVSSTRPIFSPQQTYNYYYFNRGPFYSNKPDFKNEFFQRNEKYSDLGRSELDLIDILQNKDTEGDIELEDATSSNDYDYYDYDVNLSEKSLNKSIEDEINRNASQTSTEIPILRDRNVSVNDNYVLPIINISKNAEFTIMPKNVKTNIFSHDYLNNKDDISDKGEENIVDDR